MPYLSALEVCSRQGDIQIYVFLTLPYLMCRKKHQLVTILDRAYCCMYITEEQDASEVDELSADTSQLSLSKVQIVEVGP